MNESIQSKDGQSIHFSSSGQGEIALLFVHGWLGNLKWWDSQREAFYKSYQIIQMDLIGHGNSSKTRQTWSIESFAEDVEAVIRHLKLKNVILIGHSMAGSIVIQAANSLRGIVSKIILVDTLHHVAKMPTMSEVAPLFAGLSNDYHETVTKMVPMYMFAKTSPSAVKARIIDEFSEADPAVAIASLKPFYSTNIEEDCRRLKIPVRAIQSDLYPTDMEMNRTYFGDYEVRIISGVGHYPMLEAPTEFNAVLSVLLSL